MYIRRRCSKYKVILSISIHIYTHTYTHTFMYWKRRRRHRRRHNPQGNIYVSLITRCPPGLIHVSSKSTSSLYTYTYHVALQQRERERPEPIYCPYDGTRDAIGILYYDHHTHTHAHKYINTYIIRRSVTCVREYFAWVHHVRITCFGY